MTLWVPTNLASNTVGGWWFLRDAKGVLADGANVTQAAGAVSSWADSSGNAAALTQSSGALQPAYNANGLATGVPGITNTTGQRLAVSSGLNLTKADITNVFFVGKTASGNADNCRIISMTQTGGSDTSASQGYIPFLYLGTGLAMYQSGYLAAIDPRADGTPALYEQFASDSSHYSMAMNATPGTAGSAPYIGTGTFDMLGLFDTPTGGANTVETIAEVLIVVGLLSSADLARIEGYLAWNNGIQSSLPSGHAYASAAPTVSGGAVNGSASGDTVSVAQSVIAGASTGGAAVGGAALQVSGSVLAGSASGAASVPGSTFSLTSSLLGGTALAGALASGAVIAFTQSFIAGTATGSSVGNAPGTTISVTASLTGGAATGSAAAPGGVLSLAPSLIAGPATVSVNAPGSILSLTQSIVSGAALAAAGGALLSVSSSLVSGLAQGGALASGALWTLPYAFVPGAALRVAHGPSSRPVTLLGSARVITLLGSSRAITLDRKVSMKQDIPLKIGTTWTFKDCVARDAQGNPVDITGATIEFRIVKSGALLLKMTDGLGDFTITDGSNGKYSGNLAYDDARQSGLVEGVFSYELDIISTSGGLTDQNSGNVTLAKSLHLINS